MLKEFRLPDPGEGLTEAEIVSWKVQPGDVVAVDEVIVEIETAKSLVELPCPFAGLVDELLVAEGDSVPVGDPIIVVRTEVDDTIPQAPAEQPPAEQAPAEQQTPAEQTAVERTAVESPGEPVAPQRTPVLVGYGPRTGAVTRRRRRTAPEPAGPGSAEPPSVPSTPSVPSADESTAARPLAKPPVRRLARDLGVDLATVAPTGDGGVVTRADVEGATPAGTPGGRESRTPVRGVRRMTAEAMVASAFTAPHVTEWVEADVTRSVRLVERLRSDAFFQGVRLSPLALVAKALLVAVARNPQANASFDAGAGEHGEIVTKHYVNLGIAAATPRGLVVPVIRDADRLGLRGLAEAITTLAETARAGRTAPSELTGGTITITNVGVFGVDGGTPIINPGEAAILAVGRISRKPWVHKGKVRPRWVTTLALSFDHRVVDGELGSRVLADVAAVLTDPATALT